MLYDFCTNSILAVCGDLFNLLCCNAATLRKHALNIKINLYEFV